MGHTTIYRISTSKKPKNNFNGKRKKVWNYNGPYEIDYTTNLPINNGQLYWLDFALKKYFSIKTGNKNVDTIEIPTKEILKFPEKRIKETLRFIVNEFETEKDYIDKYLEIPIRTHYTHQEEPCIIFEDYHSQTILTFDEFLSELARQTYYNKDQKNKETTTLYVQNIYDAKI